MNESAAQKIDGYLATLPVWQRDNLVAFRSAIHEVYPDIVEEWKWSVPVFMKDNRLVLAMSAFKAHTKYNFMTGAELVDPDNLFNNGFDSKRSRGIDLKEGESIDTGHLKRLLREALEIS
jgi:hypothetical protein